jgi:hypothetical protein
MRTVALPEVKERFSATGIKAVGTTQEEFTAGSDLGDQL